MLFLNTPKRPALSNWNQVKLIDRDPHWYTSRVTQAIHIRLRRKDINRDSEADLSDINNVVPRRPQREGRRLVRNKLIFYRRHSRFFLDLFDTSMAIQTFFS